MMEFTLHGVNIIQRTQVILGAAGAGGVTTTLASAATHDWSQWQGPLMFGLIGGFVAVTGAASLVSGPLTRRDGSIDIEPLFRTFRPQISPASKEEFRAAVADTYNLELSERETNELLETAQFSQTGKLKMRSAKGQPMRLGTSTVLRGQEVMTLTLVHDNGAWLLLRGEQELTPLNYEAF